MSNRKILQPVFLSAAFLALFLVASKPAYAISFEDIITGAKSFIVGMTSKKDLNITSKIELAQDGDLNGNGQIDAGDSVKFSYTIANPSKNKYKTATLNTHLKTSDVNTINNVKGVLSLDSSKDTITIPNLTINPSQVREISFVARVNLNKDTDKTISTEAELVDDKKSTVYKAEKKEVSAKKMDIDTFNKVVHITK